MSLLVSIWIRQRAYAIFFSDCGIVKDEVGELPGGPTEAKPAYIDLDSAKPKCDFFSDTEIVENEVGNPPRGPTQAKPSYIDLDMDSEQI